MPEFFRGMGYLVRTKVDVFGPRRVADVEWIKYADAEGWVALTKDDKIRRRPIEKAALHASRLRVLCLTRGGLTSTQQVERFRTNLQRIERLWPLADRPWFYAVGESDIHRLRIYGS